MAPKRRTPKVGLRRIDAAFDALRPMGFTDKVVSKTIKNLLKAYGGEDGWGFIEEYSYQLVIDTILQEQANEEHKNLEEDCCQKASLFSFFLCMYVCLCNMFGFVTENI
ncbi:hypothetical protein REPUB_Repub03eG0225600 [Reevesia pubescens]